MDYTTSDTWSSISQVLWVWRGSWTCSPGATGSAGLADSSENDKIKVLLEVVADGRPVGKAEIVYGEPVPIDIDMTEVLRLRIQWQVTSTYDEAGCGSAFVTLGDARLDGFAERIPSSATPSVLGATDPYATPTS